MNCYATYVLPTSIALAEITLKAVKSDELFREDNHISRPHVRAFVSTTDTILCLICQATKQCRSDRRRNEIPHHLTLKRAVDTLHKSVDLYDEAFERFAKEIELRVINGCWFGK